MEHSPIDEALKQAIRDAVSQGIEDALTKYGIDVKEPNAMQADMVYLRKSRIGSEEVIKWAKRSAITAIIASTLAAIWQGIKSIL